MYFLLTQYKRSIHIIAIKMNKEKQDNKASCIHVQEIGLGGQALDHVPSNQFQVKLSQ